METETRTVLPDFNSPPAEESFTHRWVDAAQVIVSPPMFLRMKLTEEEKGPPSNSVIVV